MIFYVTMVLIGVLLTIVGVRWANIQNSEKRTDAISLGIFLSIFWPAALIAGVGILLIWLITKLVEASSKKI